MKKYIILAVLMLVPTLNAQETMNANWVGNLQDETGTIRYFKSSIRGIGWISADNVSGMEKYTPNPIR